MDFELRPRERPGIAVGGGVEGVEKYEQVGGAQYGVELADLARSTTFL
jgi:hypothetical protein